MDSYIEVMRRRHEAINSYKQEMNPPLRMADIIDEEVMEKIAPSNDELSNSGPTKFMPGDFMRDRAGNTYMISTVSILHTHNYYAITSKPYEYEVRLTALNRFDAKSMVSIEQQGAYIEGVNKGREDSEMIIQTLSNQLADRNKEVQELKAQLEKQQIKFKGFELRRK